MKHSTTFRLFTALLVLSMLLTACQGAQPAVEVPAVDKEAVSGQTGQGTVENLNSSNAPDGAYNEGIVLVKSDKPLTDNVLAQLDFVSAEPLYAGSSWYSVKLGASQNTQEAVSYLRELDCFDAVDYDYVMAADESSENAAVTDNPDYSKQTNLGVHDIPNGWTKNGKHPGGSPDVIVAVIDTGVDYNHLDLRNNIWINTAEIPDNGKDDDGNGYIDDVYGWDCVGNDKDPMDDNGHGTHVAGIIAAENNKIGGVGIAYDCKIMVLKAGNSSGYFNNSDIAEAIQYAYMNGASVINMSFGGGFISIAVEEALQSAYTSCVLVAAAGNESQCNNLDCPTCDFVGVCYPGALPYVIGVMSVDPSGEYLSSFSNYDHYPHDSVEYEVYAVGEAVPSCWPNNKYATLNGTSMAAPTVSGIAALLRSYYTDREMYSTKFIQSQIVNTGTVNPINGFVKDYDMAHSVANVYEAMTRIPKPAVNLYDYRIDDSTAISDKNNGNGVIDAGETVHLFVSLMNRGGVASNVQVSIDTLRDVGLTDPYFTFTNPNITLSDIGTYSVREAYENEYFEIVVSPDCPNDYLVDFNIRFTYTNGLDKDDKAAYSGDGKARFNVSRGYHLPSLIAEDTVFAADRLYIIGEDVVIPDGVTVTFEAGCQIQFYDDRDYYKSPRVLIHGNLIFNGTQDNMIRIFPSERYAMYVCLFDVYGTLEACYTESYNLFFSTENKDTSVSFTDSRLLTEIQKSGEWVYSINEGKPGIASANVNSLFGTPQSDGSVRFVNSYLEEIAHASNRTGFKNAVAEGCHIVLSNVAHLGWYDSNPLVLRDSIIYTVYDSSIYSRTENHIGESVNNCFIAENEDRNALALLDFSYKDQIIGNAFSKAYQDFAGQTIIDYYGSDGTPTVDVFSSLADASKLWPHVVSVEMFDADGNPITVLGKQEIKVRVTFNRPMDTTKNTSLTFGTIEPYADYRIEGEYISDTVWEGTYALKAQIENGQNFLKVNNACAAEDPTKTVFGSYQLHEFTIDTSAAMAMNLQAAATDEGIHLTWAQDDYDTLMGYNIYRATSKDGNYVKINPTVLPSSESTFLDDNAEPGVTYWYTFTVVLSDFSESAPAGKVFCTAVDTIAPTIYHTPVNQGYENNNLVISCTASDNMKVATVTLYYRTVGTDAWKSITMSKVNDRYSATIFGSELTQAGLEYYIVATDGHNTVTKGSAEVPYSVIIKEASAASRLGDVDGDGIISTKDALMLMQALNGDLLLSDDQFRRADLNGDGELSSAEALRILQYINGKLTSLAM